MRHFLSRIAVQITLGVVVMSLVTSAAHGEGVADFAGTEGIRKDLASRYAELQRGQITVVRGRDGWFFLPHELAHYGSLEAFWATPPTSNAKQVNPMDAIVAFKDNLAAAGVELVLVPVPGKVVLHPEQLDPPLSLPDGVRLDQLERRFYDEIESRGVTVLDLTPAFATLKAAGTAPFCRQDSHYSPAGQRAVAQAVAALVRSRGWYADTQKVDIKTIDTAVDVNGDLVRLAQVETPTEHLVVRQVLIDGDFADAPRHEAMRRASPLVLIGDSHCLVYGDRAELLADHADLSLQITAETSLPVDVVANKGSGINAPRISLLSRKDNLAGKRCVVWVFSARSFTRALENWRVIKVVR